MARFRILPRTDGWSGRRLDAVALAALAAGFGLRYRAAAGSFVSPAEAWAALLAAPQTLGELYANAARSPHPPLFLLLLHYAREWMPTDLGLRLVPLIAGTLLPWIAYRWLGRAWGRPAGLAALGILSLAPGLVRIGSEAGAYAPALLFMAAALYLMDRAIETGSAGRMAGFALCLWAAALLDYSAAFFVLAAALYFLLRIREPGATAGVRAVWALAQIGTAALYAGLWTTGLNPLWAIAAPHGGFEGALRQAYPQPGDNPVLYALRNTAEQFAFLLAGPVPASAAIALFLAGLFLAWHRPPGEGGRRGWAPAALLVTPFVAACAASMVHLYPYGRTPDTAFLALFIAAGAGIGMGRIARSWVGPLTLAAAIAVPVWHAAGGRYGEKAGPLDTRRELMEQALEFLKRSVPPGTVILTEAELRVVLAYYLGAENRPAELREAPSEAAAGGWRLFANRWAFASPDDLRTDLAALRERYGYGPDIRIWVLDGGFRLPLGPYFRELNRKGDLPHFYEFGGAMAVALTPPGFLWDGGLPLEAERRAARPPLAGRAPPEGLSASGN